jgi:hypothetical protein
LILTISTGAAHAETVGVAAKAAETTKIPAPRNNARAATRTFERIPIAHSPRVNLQPRQPPAFAEKNKFLMNFLKVYRRSTALVKK